MNDKVLHSFATATGEGGADMPAPLPIPVDIPLCVDLDGTLVRSDTLMEALLLLIKQRPWCLFLLPFWLLGGKARVKAEIARRVRFSAASMPYHGPLLDWLRIEQTRGRRLVLASGANAMIVAAIAKELGIFAETFSSDDAINLTGQAKADALKARFDGFAYIGDSFVDLPVWQAARASVLVASSPRRERELSARVAFAHVFSAPPRSRVLLWLRALRVHQWVKNSLMFVPLILAHDFLDLPRVALLLTGFMAFNITASSVYILNDLLDLSADRQHPRKRFRPFAAGDLPLVQGLALWPFLVIAGFCLAFLTGPAFALVLAGYYILTVAYSFDLKRRALVDVFTLATLYTLRIMAGAVAASVVLSPWLLAFSIFIFLSLAIVKRVAELVSMRERGTTQIAGRGYRHDDLYMLEVLGVAAGYASVVVLSLYVSAPESRALYVHHQLLWLFAPLVLFWISRVWLKTHRGEMHDDPIVFAMKDNPSRVVFLLCFVVLALAAF